jgi:TolB protein
MWKPVMTTRTIAILLIALTLTACGVNPQGFQQWYDDHTLCTTATYNDLTWSRDGSQLYYYVEIPFMMAQVQSVSPDGGSETVLIQEAFGPRLSPDGTLILFRQLGKTASGIQDYSVFDISHNTISSLVKSAESGIWSPDNQWIAYTTNTSPGLNYLNKINIQSGEIVQLTDIAGHYWSPQWSPDGMEIIFQSDQDGLISIYAMDADGSKFRQLTHPDSEECATPERHSHRFLDWLPDSGNAFAFQRICGNERSVGLATTSGEDMGNWGDPAEKYGSVVWSPNGKNALIQVLDQHDRISLKVSDADGKDAQLLKTDAWQGVWSPDSQRIAMLVHTSAELLDIWVINADGTNARKLTNNPGNQHTCWH